MVASTVPRRLSLQDGCASIASVTSSWRELRSIARKLGDVRTVTLTMSMTCGHCGLPVPVNSPTQIARCPHCSKETPVAHLCQVLCVAAGDTKTGSSQTLTTDTWGCTFAWFDEARAECARCGDQTSITPYLAEEDPTTPIPCGSCGVGMPTFPAPEWLKEQLPTALQVFGGDEDVARAQGVDLAVNEAATKPIAMPCPSCGGGLTIKHDTARTVTCQFCSTSVFIPDALWVRLHPTKTMLRWTLTYSRKLSTDKLENARTLAKTMMATIRSRAKDAQAEIERCRAIFLVDTEDWFGKVFDEEAAALLSPPVPVRTVSTLASRIASVGAWVVVVAIVATILVIIIGGLIELVRH